MKFTKTYIRYNLTTGEYIEDMEGDQLRNDRMLFLSVSSASKLGYVTLDEQKMTYNGHKVVAIQGTFFRDNILFEIITLN